MAHEGATPADRPVGVGEPAPGFALDDQHGQRVALDELVADRAALLVFYPFAFSGICTNELVDIQQHLGDFDNERLQVVGISCDAMYTQRAWAQAQGLTFPLLSDFWPHGKVSQAYGVFSAERGMPVRGTFLVGREGRVRWSLVHGPGQVRDFRSVHSAVADLV